jgi:hypothetical protein|nr:MAG TPA: hypothetical protein [Caudoviricetes sp.]
MTIYIDSVFKCHVSAAEGRREIETSFFDGKCEEWIESYRYVPAGETWVESNGVMFHGEMIAPWKDLSDAYAAQAAYVTTQNKQYEAALTAIENALEVTT